MDPIQKADATTEDYLKRSHCVFPTREELRALVLIALGPTVSSVVVELLSSLPLGWCFPLRPGELKMSSLSLLFPLYRSSTLEYLINVYIHAHVFWRNFRYTRPY